MRAAPITSGCVPYAFENRTRTRSPPMLVWTIMRSVWLLNVTALVDCGLVAHVPTQCESPSASAARLLADAARPKHSADSTTLLVVVPRLIVSLRQPERSAAIADAARTIPDGGCLLDSFRSSSTFPPPSGKRRASRDVVHR